MKFRVFNILLVAFVQSFLPIVLIDFRLPKIVGLSIDRKRLDHNELGRHKNAYAACDVYDK